MTIKSSLFAGVLTVFALPALVSTVALADAAISDPFARATPPNAKNGAAYATISSTEGDRLISVATGAARMVQIHDTKVEDGVAKMREIEGGLEIPAGRSVTLAPGGKHVMLMGLTGPLAEGEDVTLTFTFEKAGEIEITAPIKKLKGGHAASHSHASAGGEMTQDEMMKEGEHGEMKHAQ